MKRHRPPAPPPLTRRRTADRPGAERQKPRRRRSPHRRRRPGHRLRLPPGLSLRRPPGRLSPPLPATASPSSPTPTAACAPACASTPRACGPTPTGPNASSTATPSTLVVDLGLGYRAFPRLRLRGLDTPELYTQAGRDAKAFVEAALAPCPIVVVTTRKTDAYGRYVADLAYLPGAADPPRILRDGTYLNGQLLRHKLAVRYLA